MKHLSISIRGHSRNQLQEFVEDNFTDATKKMEVSACHLDNRLTAVVERKTANGANTITVYKNGKLMFIDHESFLGATKQRSICTINNKACKNLKITIIND